MIIEIDKLPQDGATFTRDYAPGELALEAEGVRLSEPLHAEFEVRRKREEVEVHGKMRGTVEAACDRCLNGIRLPVLADFIITYSPIEAARQSEVHELRAEDMERSVFENNQIDLSELVREQLLLDLPSRLLCREDCKGLCPTCGANLNKTSCACERKEIDPRWSALAEMKKKETEDGSQKTE